MRTTIASMPMNVAAKPEPGIETNGELNPVASAFASIVLPGSGRAEEEQAALALAARALERLARLPDRDDAPHLFLRLRLAADVRELDAPLRVSRLEGLDLREVHDQQRAEEDREVHDHVEGEDHEERAGSRRGIPVHRSRRRAPPTTIATIATFSQKRQNQTRRRATTSSSRSCWLSSPKRLGRGMKRWKTRSKTPRKQTTTSERGEDRPVPRPALRLVEPDDERRRGEERDDGRGARQAAPLAGELVRELGLLETPQAVLGATRWSTHVRTSVTARL